MSMRPEPYLPEHLASAVPAEVLQRLFQILEPVITRGTPVFSTLFGATEPWSDEGLLREVLNANGMALEEPASTPGIQHVRIYIRTPEEARN
jgi:hypothetical protein